MKLTKTYLKYFMLLICFMSYKLSYQICSIKKCNSYSFWGLKIYPIYFHSYHFLFLLLSTNLLKLSVLDFFKCINPQNYHINLSQTDPQNDESDFCLLFTFYLISFITFISCISRWTTSHTHSTSSFCGLFLFLLLYYVIFNVLFSDFNVSLHSF